MAKTAMQRAALRHPFFLLHPFQFGDLIQEVILFWGRHLRRTGDSEFETRE